VEIKVVAEEVLELEIVEEEKEEAANDVRK